MRFIHITKILILLSIIVLIGIIPKPQQVNSVTLDQDLEPTSDMEEKEVDPGCNESMEIKTYAKCMVVEKWGMEHWDSFDNIIKSESGWCHTKWNGQVGSCPTVARTVKIPGASNAQGLCQTMLSVHGLINDYDFMNNPYRQIDWCIDYASHGNHGNMPFRNPNQAWNYWKLNKHW